MGKSISKLETVTTVGLDLANNVFQVHAIDAQGVVVANKAIGRGKLLGFFAALPKCLMGMEFRTSMSEFCFGLGRDPRRASFPALYSA